MKVTKTSEKTSSVVQRTLTVEGVNEAVEVVKNELEGVVTCHYSRWNEGSDSQTSIALQMLIATGKLEQDSIFGAKGIEDFRLYEELKNQVVNFDEIEN